MAARPFGKIVTEIGVRGGGFAMAAVAGGLLAHVVVNAILPIEWGPSPEQSAPIRMPSVAVRAIASDQNDGASGGPDFDMTWREWREGAWETSRVRRHAGRTRIDTTGVTEYLYVPSHLTLSVARQESGQLSFSLRVNEEEDDRWGRDAEVDARTDRRAVVAGEPCRYWSVLAWRRDAASLPDELACLTHDGIRLAKHQLASGGETSGWGSGRALEFRRRPVGLDEVTPRLPDIAQWRGSVFARQAPPKGQEDYTVLLKDGSDVMIMRRRYPWLGEETRRQDGSVSFLAYTSDNRFQLLAEVGADGRPRHLSLYDQRRNGVGPAGLVDAGETRLDERPRLILGLRCWHMAKPGPGVRRCRTTDGVPLEFLRSSIATQRTYVAQQLDRRPGDVLDIVPPLEMFDLETWGVRP